MRFFGWCLLIATLGCVAVFTWCHAEARADPLVRTARIGFRDWPRGAAPMRVLLASDIHLGNAAMDVPRLARIVGQIDALKPDLIVLAGDFVAGHDASAARSSAAALVAPLAALRAPQGVVAVLGNHDEATAPALVWRALEAAGIRVLRDGATRAGPLVVAGIGDMFTVGSNVPRTMAAVHALRGLPIAVSHSDDRAHLHGTIRLLLVGHTHCGQIALEKFGFVNPLMPKAHACGLVRDKDGVTITTAGLGTSLLPLRFRAPPDLWVVTLGPAR